MLFFDTLTLSNLIALRLCASEHREQEDRFCHARNMIQIFYEGNGKDYNIIQYLSIQEKYFLQQLRLYSKKKIYSQLILFGANIMLRHRKIQSPCHGGREKILSFFFFSFINKFLSCE